MRILIAEDDPVSCRILEAKLVRWGYDVVVAHDGNEAWRVLKSADAPRLAILDWIMPGMDGVEVCGEVRSAGQKPYIYIILLTAQQGEEGLVTGMEAGADDFITKPFKSNELWARLRAGRRIVDMHIELMSYLESRERLVRGLREALAKVKTLSGMLPICASCKKIRDDRGDWNQLETYISAHSEALFNHGYCPDCLAKAYRELEELKQEKLPPDGSGA